MAYGDNMPDNWEQNFNGYDVTTPITIWMGNVVFDCLNPLIDDADDDTDNVGGTVRFRQPDEPVWKTSFEDRLTRRVDKEGVVKAGGTLRFRLPVRHEVADKDTITNYEEYRYDPDNHKLNPSNVDTDGDQMPDEWEWQYTLYLDLLEDDSDKDPDNDGIKNVWEYNLKGFNASNGRLDPTNRDTDGDDVPDGMETYTVANYPGYAFSTTTNVNWYQDMDGDGFINALDRDSDGDDLNDYQELKGYQVTVYQRLDGGGVGEKMINITYRSTTLPSSDITRRGLDPTDPLNTLLDSDSDAIPDYKEKNPRTYYGSYMKGMGTVRLLISLNDHKNFKFYVTNQLHWNELAIATRYSRRWDIEVWHREGKVSYGLKDCQLRCDEAVKKYMTLSALAATLLEIATMRSPVYAMLIKRARTPGLKHRWIIAEIVGQLISYASNIGTMGTKRIVESILYPYKSTILRCAG